MSWPSAALESTGARATQAQYDFLRRHQLDSFQSQLPAFIDAITWPADKLRAMRTQRLRRLVSVAKAKSPWHANRLARVEPDTLCEDGLAAIPPMTKTDLMENFDEIVTDREVRRSDIDAYLADLATDAYFQRTRHAVMSGGSSGRRGLFVYDWDGWITLGLSSARPIVLALQQSPAATRQRAVALVGTHAAHSSAAFTQSFAPWILAQFESFAALPMSLPTSTLVEKLNAIQPTCMSGCPSFLEQLCFAARAGNLRIKPLTVLVGGETLFPRQQRVIEETLGAKVFNFYGCSEASCLAFSCSTGDGMHWCDDTIIAEPVDRAGSPAAAGDASEKILLTNLFNDLMPLIRYELEDSVVSGESGGCACGSAFQKVRSVMGRSDEPFCYPSGIIIHPIAFRPLLSNEEIFEYQVSQTPTGAMVRLRMNDGFDVTALKGKLAAQLAQYGLNNPIVSITVVPSIERTAAGKLRRFIPLTNASA